MSKRLIEWVSVAIRVTSRLMEWASFAIRVIIGLVLIGTLCVGTFALAQHLGEPFWVSFGLACVAFPAVIVARELLRIVSWSITHSARFLWKFRPFRLIVWGLYAFVVGAGTTFLWIESGSMAWVTLLCEVIGLAALHAAFFIASPPARVAQRMDELTFVARRHRWWRRTYVVLWLFAVAGIARWLFCAVEDLLAMNWLAIPWWKFERVHIPLAVIPAVVFAFAAFKARPPFLRVAHPRSYVRFWSEITFGRGFFSVRVPWVNLRREKKVVRQIDGTFSDGRKGSIDVGERFSFARAGWTALALVTVLSVIAFVRISDTLMEGRPQDLTDLKSYQPVVSTVVYDRTGRVMCTFGLENRTYVPISEIPLHVQNAFKAAEDKNFDVHDGIDPNGIIRAQIANLKSGGKVQGASTLDQQMIKQIILKDSSKSYTRKLSEVLLAVRFERQMVAKYGREGAKQQILGIYLTHVYLGGSAYGVEAASEKYFSKSVKNLTLAEASMLAGLSKAPSNDSPINHRDRANVRQRYVLGRMLARGYITKAEYEEALAEPIVIIHRSQPPNVATAPFACENVRKWAERMFGPDAVNKQGLTIHTTFDLPMQEEAQTELSLALPDLERRLGFAGPEGHSDDESDLCDGPIESIVDNASDPSARVIARDRSSITVCVRGNRFPLDADDVERVERWERAKTKRELRVGDLLTVRVVTRQNAEGETERVALNAHRTSDPDGDGRDADGHPANPLQAALVAIDPQSGEIRAIVGGYDWNESQYDNATQAHRQTGSSIKPYIYLSALMDGETVVTTVHDGPGSVDTATGPWWPRNYDDKYYGTVNLMTALAKSLNSVSTRLLIEVGLDEAIGTMRSLGIASPIVRVYPLSVGTPEFTLLEHTAAYAEILSNGRALSVQHVSGAPGTFVTLVTTRTREADGTVDTRVLYEAEPRPDRQAVPAGDAYAMTHLMKGVVEFGTGTRAKTLRRPVAGKTGTTNNNRDTWFIGGTTDLVVGVWVGRTTPEEIAPKATGGVIALPIWEGFMEAAFPVPEDGTSFATPPRDFPIPDDVTLIDRGEERGGVPVLLPFQRGKMPKAYLRAPAVDFDHGAFQ